MGPSRPWRRQLLGTLQGQLQLATYLAVFVGFTGASIAGLWIGQRNLIDSTRGDLNQSAQAIEICMDEAGAYDITCKGGKEDSKYKQVVTRSFRLSPDDGGEYENPDREYAFEAPEHSHVECQADDPWGVIWYNKHLKAGNMKACIPPAARTKQAYLASDPADWLYDLSDFGWGRHPDY